MPPLRFPRRFARLLLRLAPASFRTEFGADIEADFQSAWDAARGRGRWWRRLRLAADLLAAAPREWRDELTRPPSHPEPRRPFVTGIDLKHLIRWLVRSPAFAVSALATLAVGIGTTTAIFGVFFGVLLRPLPFAEPGRLAHFTREGDVSIPDGVDWRARTRTWESIGLYARSWGLDLTGVGDPEPVRVHAVEPEFLDVLRIQPIAGRRFTAAENQPGGEHLILITEGFWESRFSRAANAVGRQLTLGGNPATIIGVLPRTIDFLDDDIIGVVPIAVEMPWAVSERGVNNLDAIGRLRPGASMADASREIVAITTDLAAEYPRTNRGKIVTPIPLLDYLVGDVRPSLWVTLAAVVLLLLIASVNLAGLLVARVTGRRRELAVRMALGAGAGRITRQLVFEGFALGAAGGLLGFGVAAAALVFLRGYLPASVPSTGLGGFLPRTGGLGLSGAVLAFGAGATLLAGLLCGVLPAFRARRQGALEGLASARGSGERHRFRSLRLVVASEVALAVALLAAAGVLAKSFRSLWNQPLGFDPAGVLSAELVLPESRYADPDEQTRAYTAIIDRLAETPGVTAAGYVTTLPLYVRGGIGNKLLFEGRPDLDPDAPSGVRVRPVYGDYFGAMKLPVVKGRPLAESDRAGALPVAVINESLARAFWPDRDPIGQRVALRDWHAPETGPVWMTIVGVARDVKGVSLDLPDQAALYMPYVQRQVPWQRFGSLVIRTSGDPESFRRPLAEAVWSVDPLLALGSIQTMATRRSASVARQRFLAATLALFAAAAILLVVQGLWGIVSYAVAERRREIGVRMALGAAPGSVVALVAREALLPMAAGGAVGLGIALAGGRLLESALFQVSPADPVVLAGTLILTAAIAVLASAVPAWRAAGVDPLETIRAE
ncbi:MAG: ABC transporter permease [Gemmatimonadales bacterium]